VPNWPRPSHLFRRAPGEITQRALVQQRFEVNNGSREIGVAFCASSRGVCSGIRVVAATRLGEAPLRFARLPPARRIPSRLEALDLEAAVKAALRRWDPSHWRLGR
jgi:hypothetical protein